MLRKITHIILSSMLLVTTMGYTVSRHYCGDRLISISINAEAESCCGINSGCCHDEPEYCQLEEDYVSPVVLQNVQIANFKILFPIVFSHYYDEPGPEFYKADEFTESPIPPKIQTILSTLQTYLC